MTLRLLPFWLYDSRLRIRLLPLECIWATLLGELASQPQASALPASDVPKFVYFHMDLRQVFDVIVISA